MKKRTKKTIDKKPIGKKKPIERNTFEKKKTH